MARDWREVLAGVPWWSVLLTASSATLTTRETQRGDRPAGLAVADLAAVPQRRRFDLVIDADAIGITDSVAAIHRLIEQSGQSQ